MHTDSLLHLVHFRDAIGLSEFCFGPLVFPCVGQFSGGKNPAVLVCASESCKVSSLAFLWAVVCWVKMLQGF